MLVSGRRRAGALSAFFAVMNTVAAKRAAAEALIKAAKGKAPKGVALVDFREPTAAERRKGRQWGTLARSRRR